MTVPSGSVGALSSCPLNRQSRVRLECAAPPRTKASRRPCLPATWQGSFEGAVGRTPVGGRRSESQQVPDLPGPIPQPPPDGTLNDGPLRPELAVPKTENCFSRSSLAHLGHATVLEDESTRVSNRWPQARQEYSKSGMADEGIRAVGLSGDLAIRLPDDGPPGPLSSPEEKDAVCARR